MTTTTRTRTKEIEIAITTLKHLGGTGKLRAMIQMDQLTYDSEGTVTFRFKGSRKANLVRIRLENDLYELSFYKQTPKLVYDPQKGTIMYYDLKEKSRYTEIQAENMIQTFEEATHTCLTLGNLSDVIQILDDKPEEVF